MEDCGKRKLEACHSPLMLRNSLTWSSRSLRDDNTEYVDYCEWAVQVTYDILLGLVEVVGLRISLKEMNSYHDSIHNQSHTVEHRRYCNICALFSYIASTSIMSLINGSNINLFRNMIGREVIYYISIM
jgi:hypothetical protein